MEFESNLNGKTYQITIDGSRSEANVNGSEFAFSVSADDPEKLIFRVGTKVFKVDNINIDGREVQFSVNGTFLSAEVKNEDDLLLEKLGFTSNNKSSAGMLAAPMPGKILEILVKENDEVKAGQPVIILEAMKMENELKAPADGIVKSLLASKNDNVEKKQPLIEITPRG